MNVLISGFLGILQGFTEFLPVSSSGHLVIAQKILPELDSPGVLFEVVLHMGTLLAILFYYWRKILTMNKNIMQALVIGTIPAVIVGFFLSTVIERLFASVTAVGVFLIATGVINYFTDKTKDHSSREFKVTTLNAFLIGIAQSIAILPGISRSGSTIFAGTKLGLSKEDAAEFSFLLSIPAVVGANALELVKYSSIEIDILPFIVGFIASFVSGYVAIKLLLSLLKGNKFKYFSVYCIFVGLLVIFL